MTLFGYHIGIAADTLFFLIGFYFLYRLLKPGVGRRSVARVVLLVFGALLFFYTGYVAQKSGYIIATHHTANMSPIDLTFKNSHVHVRVPEAYLPTVSDQNGGEVEFLRLDAVLPDMRPSRLVANEVEGNLVYIDLYGGDGYDPSRRRERMKNLQPYLEDVPGTPLKKLKHQFYEDSRKFIVKEGGFFEYKDHYVYWDGDRYAEIGCERTSPRCEVYASFDHHLHGSYSISIKFIPNQWQSVDKEITGFVTSLELDPTESKDVH